MLIAIKNVFFTPEYKVSLGTLRNRHQAINIGLVFGLNYYYFMF